MELYVIRHAQSTNNASMIADPTDRVYDAPLTDLGHRQAEALGRHLRDGVNPDRIVDAQTRQQPNGNGLRGFEIDRLYCSPMYRTLQTARHIQESTGLTPHLWVAIHEHGGVFQRFPDRGVVGFPGRTRSEIAAEFPDYVLTDDVTEQGWWTGGEEALTAAYGRAIHVAHQLAQVAADEPELRVALVTHGTFTGALLKALFDQVPSHGLWYSFYNTSITRVDLRPDGRRWLRSMNRVDHLDAELVSS